MTSPLHISRVLLHALTISCLLLTAASANAQNQPVRDTIDVESDEDTAVLVEYPDGEETLREQTRAERSEALQRRAGEQIGDDPRGRTVVLGMSVQESDSKRMKVVDVGAASPAFDAGIRKGDEIVSFDGFQADSYREWVDGIRKLVNDAKEEETMPIELRRDGEVIKLRLRKPAASADELPDGRPGPLNQPLGQSPSEQPPLPMPQPNQIYQDNSEDIGVAPFFGGQFGETLGGGATERAMAEIFRLDGSQQATQSNARGRRSRAGGGGFSSIPGRETAQMTTTGTAGNRIGLAGFRDTQNGMVVMLDVGGLSPGNYLVGIGDAGMLGSTTGNIGTQTPATPQQRQSQTRRPNDGTRRGTDPPRRVPNQPSRGGGGGQPQGSIQPSSTRIPVTVLAQVLDQSQSGSPSEAATTPVQSPPTTGQAGQPLGQSRPPGTPVPGQGGFSDIPATSQTDLSQTNPGNAAATGQSGQTGTTNNQNGLNSNTGGASFGTGSGAGPAINVGTLTIDQSGTGRLQQTVDGVQVQNVVGQMLVIYSQNVSTNNSQPAGLNSDTAPLGPQGARSQGARATTDAPPQGGGQAIGVADESQFFNQPTGQAANTTNGGQRAVAAGDIRLMSDRRPESGTGFDAGNQPAANLPAGEQGLR